MQTEPLQTTPLQPITTIDMFTPSQACHELVVDEPELLAMVNDGRLPAYNLGGHIRFKIVDVATMFCLRAVA